MEHLRILYIKAKSIAFDPRHTKWLCPLLLIGDGVLCGLIIKKISYTEIDWSSYMQQVVQYRQGERDYAAIKGDTGPLVYPGAHVLIYNALYVLTREGTDIFRAQCTFALVYLATLSVVMSTYQKTKAPPYLYVLLVLSKRLHSIALLRLFNDCFAVLALFSAIYFYQQKIWTFGSLAYSFGVGVKMPLLLAAPAVAMILVQALPFQRAFNSASLMAQAQVLLGLPFLLVNPQSYVTNAFNIGRRFLFKWTVNWRFVGEELFLSPEFSLGLLLTNIVLIFTFVLTRWIRPLGLSFSDLVKTAYKPLPTNAQQKLSQNITPDFVLTCTLSSMQLGLLCARSLHYQFYAYVAWATPFLLWKTGMRSYLVCGIWAAQEWAWNAYPSTNASSIVVIGCLLIQVAGVWWGTRDDFSDAKSPARVDAKIDQHNR